MPNRHVIGIGHSCLIQRHVHIKSFACSFSNVMEIAFAQVRPERTMFISVNRKVEHSAAKLVILKDLNVLCEF